MEPQHPEREWSVTDKCTCRKWFHKVDVEVMSKQMKVAVSLLSLADTQLEQISATSLELRLFYFHQFCTVTELSNTTA